jgi:hypothetical protein
MRDYTTGPCNSMLNSRLLHRLLFGPTLRSSTASRVHGQQINCQFSTTVCLNTVLAIFHFVFAVGLRPGPTIIPYYQISTQGTPEKEFAYIQCSLVSNVPLEILLASILRL